MNSTNPKKLRAELKDYLDLASNEPIRIQRREGSSYVLMAEAHYQNLQNEVLSLQRRLLGAWGGGRIPFLTCDSRLV